MMMIMMMIMMIYHQEYYDWEEDNVFQAGGLSPGDQPSWGSYSKATLDHQHHIISIISRLIVLLLFYFAFPKADQNPLK